MSLFDLSGRVVVVTGCNGQLGRHFTRALLDHGARVLGLDRSPEQVDRDLDPDMFLYLETDVTEPASLQAARQKGLDRFAAPVFGLLNNAALDSPPDADARENGPFETYPLESWENVLRVNATGPFLCSQVFGADMARERRGSIVNVGSIYGILSPDQNLYQYRRDQGETFYKPVAYSASKSALYNLTRYLASYWGPRQVRVNIVTFAGVANNQPDGFLKGYLPKVPLGRMATPQDYAGAIVFLMSDASVYMTGSNLVIDGGFSAI